MFTEPVPGPSTEEIIRLPRDSGLLIAFGIIEIENDDTFCTHLLVGKQGKIGKQRKVHVPTHKQPHWKAGDEINVFDTGKSKVGISICRDSFFDEYTRTLYFKGAEVVLMSFTYYNVPRSKYLGDTIHGMSLIKASWTNGYYSVVCSSAERRAPNDWEPEGRRFPGWAGVFNPWGERLAFVDREGNDEAIVIQLLDPDLLEERRCHANFLAAELRPEVYDLGERARR